MAVFLAAVAGNSPGGDVQSLRGELSKQQRLMQHLPRLCLLLCKAGYKMKIGIDPFSKHSAYYERPVQKNRLLVTGVEW